MVFAQSTRTGLIIGSNGCRFNEWKTSNIGVDFLTFDKDVGGSQPEPLEAV